MRKKTLKGEIRTKEHCLNCGGKFEHMRPKVRRFVKSVVNPEIEREAKTLKDARLMCPKCMTEPRRYFLDFYFKERLRIFSDQQGNPLSSYEQAIQLLSNIRNEIKNNTFDANDYLSENKFSLSFNTKIEEWIQHKEKLADKGDLAYSYTREIKRYVKTYYKPHFKNIAITDVRTGDIDRFYYSLSSHLSSKTQKNIMDTLKTFFMDMYHKEYILRIPRFHKITVPEPDWVWIDEDIQNQLINTIVDHHKPIYFFMSRQGVRPGEAQALQWEDVDFDRCIVTIKRTMSLGKLRNFTKTKRIRHIPLHSEVLDMLKKIRGVSGHVFRQPNGTAYTKSVLWYHWELAKDKLVKEEKISEKLSAKLRLYDGTRHSVASQAVNRGVDLNLIGKVLGHSRTDMTNRYAHVLTNTLKSVIEAPKTVTILQHQSDFNRAPIGHQGEKAKEKI